MTVGNNQEERCAHREPLSGSWSPLSWAQREGDQIRGVCEGLGGARCAGVKPDKTAAKFLNPRMVKRTSKTTHT